MRAEKTMKTEEGFCHDTAIKTDCIVNTLRVHRYYNDSGVTLSHHTCGLPENINSKTLFWKMKLTKDQAISLGKGLIQSFENE